MIPNKSLVQPPIPKPFLPPDTMTTLPLIDYQMGGVGLSDPSLGLQVQLWRAEVLGTGADTTIWISSPNTASTQILADNSITWMRFSFDQNMHPVVSYICGTGPVLFWWDPEIPGDTKMSLPTGVTWPCVSLDDKRALQTRLGSSDVILAYINNFNLCYRQERDRYGTEYTLFTNLNTVLSNPLLNKIGMDNSYRLQFELYGQLYQ